MKTTVKGGDAIRTYASRRSATEVLRKIGIKASDYDMFVNTTTDDRHAVFVDKAKEYLQARLRNVARDVPKMKNRGRTESEAESNVTKRVSAAATIRKLILDGEENKAIHELMKKEFGHTEEQAHYPCWYRSQMRRQGLVDALPVKRRKTAKAASKKVPAKRARK